MLTVVYLGTGAAVPSPGRDNTSLALDDGREVTLVDTSGSPLKRLADAGIAPDRLKHVVITHEHLDHTFGFPSLLQSLWLAGRREPLPVYAQDETWRLLDRLVDAYRPASWTDGFPIQRHTIVSGDRPFLETATFSLRSAPGCHSVPTVGLRLESAGGSVVTYSSDTSPCETITDLARGSDVLIYESTFLAGEEAQANRLGHSTAGQAAQAALAAGVRRLVLLHFTPSATGDLVSLRQGAAAVFTGPIEVPFDLDRTSLP